MPRRRASRTLNEPDLYDELRKQGASKEKAARISNAVARDGAKAVGRRGGKAGDYEDWTVPELRKRAKELGVTGYSGTRKAELIAMLRNH
ncbi:Rho termination factor N-terminal domain-containing protein [Microbacterium aoyamense]|uniref:Rho termination factor N-terminal domain-containing protein n=1 Tax=Microbacterium aoyamense TaxID=344166 RepID=A0ABP5AU58_9MICO|nr:Rho termination factor N-terminal domain-containing protein [Microbacterium aoyamense]